METDCVYSGRNPLPALVALTGWTTPAVCTRSLTQQKPSVIHQGENAQRHARKPTKRGDLEGRRQDAAVLLVGSILFFFSVFFFFVLACVLCWPAAGSA